MDVFAMIEPLGGNDHPPEKPTLSHEYELHVDFVPIADVYTHDKIKYNNNNNYDYGVDPDDITKLIKLPTPQRPEDYNHVRNFTFTPAWIDQFQPYYKVINLPRRHLGWMKEASKLACHREGLSEIFEDDISATVSSAVTGDIFDKCDRSVPATGYFVRTDTVSLKCGVHGVGPYFSLKEILESSVTGRCGHQGIDESSQQIKFYLMPWKENMPKFREFRVFVHEARVTAISQQFLYSSNEALMSLADDAERNKRIHKWVKLIVEFAEGKVVSELAPLKSFVLDMSLLSHEEEMKETDATVLKPYFIEINPFGFNYSSGSALFDWIGEFSKLYGRNGEGRADSRKIFFRYTV
eukprot:PhF_6_TR13182/c0_g1_i2/m.20798